MSDTTRERLLVAARGLFAERGFDGVSIALIASELGITKQALLHHFGSKEKLYGEVLKRISDEFAELRADRVMAEWQPVRALQSYFAKLIPTGPDQTQSCRLLMRELLDNHRRAETAQNWYLSDFLEGLIAMVQRVPGWESATRMQALAFAYQIFGSINYFAVSGPTRLAILGKGEAAELNAAFGPQLDTLIETGLANPPAQ
ncbi:MAG: TetR/AcrR family transcriptional regulator [Pseudomonadota bacterium]